MSVESDQGCGVAYEGAGQWAWLISFVQRPGREKAGSAEAELAGKAGADRCPGTCVTSGAFARLVAGAPLLKAPGTPKALRVMGPWAVSCPCETGLVRCVTRLLETGLLLLFSRSLVSNSLRPQGLQHARLPCSSPTPGACSSSCPLSR